VDVHLLDQLLLGLRHLVLHHAAKPLAELGGALQLRELLDPEDHTALLEARHATVPLLHSERLDVLLGLSVILAGQSILADIAPELTNHTVEVLLHDL